MRVLFYVSSFKLLICLLAFALSMSACARHSISGTNDPILDADLQELQVHERNLEILGKQIDSLSCIVPRTPEQEEELKVAKERWEWRQEQWGEVSRRAAERAHGNWNRVCPIKRGPGFSCVE
jgi:hypothetical protein